MFVGGVSGPDPLTDVLLRFGIAGTAYQALPAALRRAMKASRPEEVVEKVEVIGVSEAQGDGDD